MAVTRHRPSAPLTLREAPDRDWFVVWIQQRLDAGESRAVVGQSLGVTAEAIRLYLNGMRPSDTVLLLAGYLMREPQEMTPGLPAPADVRDSG